MCNKKIFRNHDLYWALRVEPLFLGIEHMAQVLSQDSPALGSDIRLRWWNRSWHPFENCFQLFELLFPLIILFLKSIFHGLKLFPNIYLSQIKFDPLEGISYPLVVFTFGPYKTGCLRVPKAWVKISFEPISRGSPFFCISDNSSWIVKYKHHL